MTLLYGTTSTRALRERESGGERGGGEREREIFSYNYEVEIPS